MPLALVIDVAVVSVAREAPPVACAKRVTALKAAIFVQPCGHSHQTAPSRIQVLRFLRLAFGALLGDWQGYGHSTALIIGVVQGCRSSGVSSRSHWSHPPGSNRRPADYESAALPTELGWLGFRATCEESKRRSHNISIGSVTGYRGPSRPTASADNTQTQAAHGGR